MCFLVIFLATMATLMILIHSASKLPSLRPFVQKILPVSSFSLASNLESQLKRCKQLSIKDGEEESVGRTTAGCWGRDSDGEMNGRIQIVCLSGVWEGIFGKTREWEGSSGRSKTFSATS